MSYLVLIVIFKKKKRINKMKNIAIFNSFHGHFEVMGFFIYYCYINKYNLTIFTTMNKNYGWIDFYYVYFKDLNYFFKTRNFEEFNKEQLYFLDKVIITTEHDKNKPQKLITDYPQKFIFICHIPKRMKDHYIPIFPFKGLSKFKNFVMPVFPINIESLNLQSHRKFKILLVGDGYDPKLITPHDEIEYTWISRHDNKIHSNVKKYHKASTFRLMNELKKCDFLFYPHGWHQTLTHFHAESMSGLLPLAISTCKPIIFQSERVPSIIGMKNCIIHKNSDLVEKLKKFRYDYSKHLELRNQILEHNLTILDLQMNQTKNMEYLSQYGGNIHFIWISDDISEKIPIRYLPNIQTFQNFNPKAKIKIWNRQDIKRLLTDKKYENFFEKLPTNLHRADFSRMLIIYLFGGIYSDLDFYCVHNLYDLFHDKEIAFFFEPMKHAKQVHLKNLVCSGFFYSREKKNPILKIVIEDMIHHFEKRYQLHPGNSFYTLGPYVLSELYNKKIIQNNIIYESHYIIPILDTIKFSDEKQKNMEKISFVYTIWKEGHWDLEKDNSLIISKVVHNLQYYIENPEQYEFIALKNKSESDKSSNISQFVIVCMTLIIFIILSVLYRIYF
jgi:mannosyltransferase OCH1-like enzyme